MVHEVNEDCPSRVIEDLSESKAWYSGRGLAVRVMVVWWRRKRREMRSLILGVCKNGMKGEWVK